MSPSRSRDERPPCQLELQPQPRVPTAWDQDEVEVDDAEEEGLDLPPLTEDDGEEPADDFQELLASLDDAEDPLDDATASDLDPGVELLVDDSSALDDEAGEDLDVGQLDEALAGGEGESWLDEPAREDDRDDDDLQAHDAGESDDGGAEGTDEDPADDVDESALPALDADEGGTYEADDLLAELPDLADDRPPAWDALPWVVVDGAGAAVPCCALAVWGGYVIASGACGAPRERAASTHAGEGARERAVPTHASEGPRERAVPSQVSKEGAAPADAPARQGGRSRRDGRTAAERGALLLVEPGAHTARRAGIEVAASSVAFADGAIVIATRRGNLLRSTDGGRTATSLGTWGAGDSPVTLAMTPGRLWVLAGATLWSPTPGARASDAGPPATTSSARHDDAGAAPITPALSQGPAVRDGVLQIAASEGVIVALARAPGGLQIERLRGDDEGSPAVSLSGAALKASEAADRRLAAAAAGRALALAGGGVLCVSRDGGETFRVLTDMPPVVGVAFAGEHRKAPLLALVAREQEQRLQLVHIPASEAPTLVAELDLSGSCEADDEPAPLGSATVAWDSGREVAWIACRAGLVALTGQRKH